MSSTLTKSLKQPDEFQTATRGLFDWLADHFKSVIVFAVGIMVVFSAVSYLRNRDESASIQGKEALFKAQQTLEREILELAKKTAPAVPAKETKNETTDPKAAEQKRIAEMEYKKIDVDAQLPQTVAAFRDVAAKFAGFAAGRDAQLALADLYYAHGDAAKAVPLLKSVVDHASGDQQELALYSLAYALEQSHQYKEAIAAHEKLIISKDFALKGDSMLAIARCYEGAEDKAQAKAAYDRLIITMPGTEYARSAEVFKAKL